MSKIGGWWFARHEARSAETVVWWTKANRAQGNRAVGGKLYLTTERVLFSPHLLDAAFRGQTCAIELPSVIAVERQLKGTDRLGGGIRDRLRLVIEGGLDELFVVNQLDSAITRLGEAASSARGRAALLQADRREDLLVCRVCGLRYDSPPWGPERVYEFCDCCGVQFSYQDSAPESARKWRQEWLAQGVEWFKPERRPTDWDVESQLAQVPQELR